MRSLYRVGGTARVAKPLARRGRLGRMVVVRLLAGGALPVMAGAARAAGETMVSLTFNDGLLTQYTNARPVLQAHNMNATFYVVSGWVDKNASGYMQWWQADDLYRDGNEIGGMGTDYKDLTQVYNSDWMQDYAYKRDQVRNDRQRLAQLGYDPQSFAYPAGAHRYTFPDGSTIQDIVKGCGYLAARAVGGLSASGPTYAETPPPRDDYAVRTATSSTTPMQLSALQGMVTAAASREGPITDTTLNALLDRLRDDAPSGTVVKTVRQVMSGD